VSTSPSPSIRVLEDLEAPGSALELWRSLQWHPWTDFDFYTERLAREPGFVRPYIMQIDPDGDRPALVAASLVDEEITWRVGSMALLRSQARVLRIGTSGVMGDPSPETARTVVRHVLDTLAARKADVAYLHQIEADSALAEAAATVPTRISRDRFARRAPRWILELPESFEALVETRSKSVKKTIKRCESLARRKIPDLRVVCYREPEDLDRLVVDCDVIAHQTYQRRLGVGFRDDPETRERIAWLLRKGWLLAHVLYSGSKPIAFWHHIRYGGDLHTRETGFDTEYGDCRPGFYLLTRVVAEHCGSAKTRRVDFGTMDADYKRWLGSHCSDLVSMYLFAPTLAGTSMAARRSWTGVADRAARSLLGSSRARKWARRLAGRGRPGPS
jgi:hypothetical protein